MRNNIYPIPLGVDHYYLQSLSRLIERVCLILEVDPKIIRQPSKIRSHAETRGTISYIAVRELRYRGNEVGQKLGSGLGAALKAAYLAGESPVPGIAYLPG